MTLRFHGVRAWRWGLLSVGACVAFAGGCTSSHSGTSLYLLGSPVLDDTVARPSTTDGGATVDGSGFFDDEGRANTDPCDESTSRKFVRISMRNAATSDYVHYFVAFVAFVNSERYPNGAVCPDDVELYTDFGYTPIEEGETVAYGNYCLEGPALLYFHRDGQFRSGGGTGDNNLASAIAPARGTSSSADNFFRSGGAQVPVPNLILWHNPGTGPGSGLKVARTNPDPCNTITFFTGEGDCAQDAFYYVDSNDLLAGSARLGTGSAVRVPNEIQGSGCNCAGSSTNEVTQSAQQLGPSGARAADARCNEFLRGGSIEYVFLREDTTPAFAQLVWRVTDSGGSVVHEFDENARIP